MNSRKLVEVLTKVGANTPFEKVLMAAGAICIIKGVYILIKTAKEEGYREALLDEDEDETPEESPKTIKSITKAAIKKANDINNTYGNGISWIVLGWDCLRWMDIFDRAIAIHNYQVAIRERTQKKNLVSAICKFSRKLSNECNEQYNLADGMDHSKMGYKFVLQKAKVLDRACDWLDECIEKPMADAGAFKR